MSPLILILFVGLFVHDAVAGENPAVAIELSGAARLALILVPKLALGFLYHLVCGHYRRRIGRGDGQRILRTFDRLASVFRGGMVALYLADLFALSALLWVREILFDTVLVDELIVMLPTLLLMMWMWLSFYGLDRQLRESSLMGRLDRSKPVHILTRGQFVLSQLRHQWALMGVPLLMIVGWTEFVETALVTRVSEAGRAGLLLAGTAGVFLFTPLLMRFIWDTVPLPAGEMRTMLTDMCRQHRVGVRDLLLWRTFGGMINGAVMGLFRPLRYILLTDALLETMPAKQVEAVMAHELAHVRKHHMFWMLVVAGAAMQLLQWTAGHAMAGLFSLALRSNSLDQWPRAVVAMIEHPDAAALVAMMLSLVGWFYVFGWISRRFERQADSFAVQHLARRWHLEQQQQRSELNFGMLVSSDPATAATPMFPGERGAASAAVAPDAPDVSSTSIPSAAADAMVRALQIVADLNAIPTQRKSWRHGSIAWRQEYLRTLPGQSINDLAIDRQVFRIQIAGIVLLLAAVALQVWA